MNTQVEFEMPLPCVRCNRLLSYTCEDNCDDEELPLNPGLTRIHTSANMPYEDFDDVDLAICIPETVFMPGLLPLVREPTQYAPARDRVGDEKYFRQAIQVFNKAGKLVNSGFVQINDYTRNCEMVKVCNKYKSYLHAFERWEHHGSKFFKTDKFNIVGLESGNILDVTLGIPAYMTEVRDVISELPDVYYSTGDLEKDMYSEVLLACLEEMSSSNTPQHLRELRNKCAIEKSVLLMTENEKIIRDELRVKAWYEISRVFDMKNLEQDQEQEPKSEPK